MGAGEPASRSAPACGRARRAAGRQVGRSQARTTIGSSCRSSAATTPASGWRGVAGSSMTGQPRSGSGVSGLATTAGETREPRRRDRMRGERTPGKGRDALERGVEPLPPRGPPYDGPRPPARIAARRRRGGVARTLCRSPRAHGCVSQRCRDHPPHARRADADRARVSHGRARLAAAERGRAARPVGRHLAADVASGEDIPAFDNSAMDGHAVRSAVAAATETAPRLRLAGSPAQVIPPRPVGAGEAFAISTGAAVAGGADAVVRVEDTSATARRCCQRRSRRTTSAARARTCAPAPGALPAPASARPRSGRSPPSAIPRPPGCPAPAAGAAAHG